MKLIIGIAIALTSLSGGLHAQEAVVTTGGNATGSGGSSSYSMGQVFYTSQNGANGSVAQGVQQTYEITTTVGIELDAINLKLMAYPNPTSSILTLKIDAYNNKELIYHLINSEGKLLETRTSWTAEATV